MASKMGRVLYLLGVCVPVVRAVHHLVSVILSQDVWVVAYALDEQILPLSMKAIPLHHTYQILLVRTHTCAWTGLQVFEDILDANHPDPSIAFNK